MDAMQIMKAEYDGKKNQKRVDVGTRVGAGEEGVATEGCMMQNRGANPRQLKRRGRAVGAACDGERGARGTGVGNYISHQCAAVVQECGKLLLDVIT